MSILNPKDPDFIPPLQMQVLEYAVRKGEGEHGVDTDRWGVGVAFRIHAIQCAVSIYSCWMQLPGRMPKEQRIDRACEAYAILAEDTGVDMGELLTRQLIYDMYDAARTCAKQDREAVA